MHVETWRAGIGKLIARGVYSPTTANGWLNILRHVTKRARRELQLPFDAAEGIPAFDTSEHATYTEEEPNALTSEETAAFLACMKEQAPAQYAMAYLGFATGLRPSSMRPLRRTGSTPDVLWDQGVILVRRSHTIGEELMNTTKTKLRQRITVPSEIVDVLRWHVTTQLVTPEQKASELLFPAEDGGLRSVSFLKKAFATSGPDRPEQAGHAPRDAPHLQRSGACRQRRGASSPRASAVTRPTGCESTTLRSRPTSSAGASETWSASSVPARVGREVGRVLAEWGGFEVGRPLTSRNLCRRDWCRTSDPYRVNAAAAGAQSQSLRTLATQSGRETAIAIPGLQPRCDGPQKPDEGAIDAPQLPFAALRPRGEGRRRRGASTRDDHREPRDSRRDDDGVRHAAVARSQHG